MAQTTVAHGLTTLVFLFWRRRYDFWKRQHIWSEVGPSFWMCAEHLACHLMTMCRLYWCPNTTQWTNITEIKHGASKSKSHNLWCLLAGSHAAIFFVYLFLYVFSSWVFNSWASRTTDAVVSIPLLCRNAQRASLAVRGTLDFCLSKGIWIRQMPSITTECCSMLVLILGTKIR